MFDPKEIKKKYNIKIAPQRYKHTSWSCYLLDEQLVWKPVVRSIFLALYTGYGAWEITGNANCIYHPSTDVLTLARLPGRGDVVEPFGLLSMGEALKIIDKVGCPSFEDHPEIIWNRLVALATYGEKIPTGQDNAIHKVIEGPHSSVEVLVSPWSKSDVYVHIHSAAMPIIDCIPWFTRDTLFSAVQEAVDTLVKRGDLTLN